MNFMVFLAPGNNLHERGCQVDAFRRKSVKHLGLTGRMRCLGDNAGAFELGEPIGKNIGSDTFAALQKISVCTGVN